MSDASAFGTIIFFAYSSVATVRFSSLLRTIVADATVYFIMIASVQTLVLFFLSLADVGHHPLPILILLTYSLLGYDESIPPYVRTSLPDLWNFTSS